MGPQSCSLRGHTSSHQDPRFAPEGRVGTAVFPAWARAVGTQDPQKRPSLQGQGPWPGVSRQPKVSLLPGLWWH